MHLNDYLSEAGVDAGLKTIIQDLAEAGKAIMDTIRVVDPSVALESENSSGETQMALDVMSNDILVEVLSRNEHVAVVGSEELEDLPKVREEGYSVVFDPLDGSSLLDVNLAVGTIVGIYKGADVLGRTGREQVASMIFTYGPRISLMLTVKDGTHEFRLEEDVFVRTQANIKLDSNKKMFSPGNLRAAAHSEGYRNLINYWLDEEYKLRYSGGMVPDINQILLKGCGIFTYPGYRQQPNGKLRLLFECAPIALLIEQAGGKASDGLIDILDKKIEEIHQRTPIFVGKAEQVDHALEFLS